MTSFESQYLAFARAYLPVINKAREQGAVIACRANRRTLVDLVTSMGPVLDGRPRRFGLVNGVELYSDDAIADGVFAYFIDWGKS